MFKILSKEKYLELLINIKNLEKWLENAASQIKDQNELIEKLKTELKKGRTKWS